MAKTNLGSSKRAGRVLVLDDEAEVCRYIAGLIEGLGFEVETASDAALVYLHELKDSDTIFIDILMPRMDGLQILEVLSRRNSRCRIVLMCGTNEDPTGAIAMAKERGLELIGVLFKPFRLEHVKEVMDVA
jgi:CheY-like chemotaxis protein